MAASVASATGRRRSGPTPMLDLPVMPSALASSVNPGFVLERVLDCTIPGTPVPKARARKGAGGRWYTPEATASQEASIRQYVSGWMLATRVKPIEGPIIVEVHSMFSRPSGNKTQMHTQRPDWDNLGKVTDALNGVAWNDDCQVVCGLSQKGWAVTPCVRIIIYRVKHEESI